MHSFEASKLVIVFEYQTKKLVFFQFFLLEGREVSVVQGGSYCNGFGIF